MNKYEKLIEKLNGYSISRFDDISIVGEFFMVDKIDNEEISYISVFVTDNEELNIVIEVEDEEGNYVEIENKIYKSVNGAYNKIVKVLG